MAHPSRVNRRAGFTLVELLLVMLILVTLAGIVLPRMTHTSSEAKIKATMVEIENLKMALQTFEIQAGRFPTESEGLAALVRKPADLSDDQWHGKYMEKVPKDSWGMPFQYHIPSSHDRDFDLISSGPDMILDTADDLTNFAGGDGIDDQG